MKYVSCKFKILFSVFAFIFLFASSVFSANYTTYQAKIIKPDGYPLEAGSVNFKFTILSPAGNCILYSENYSSVNMANSGGVISFSLGSGVKTYPVSSPTFFDIFNNGVANLSCDAGGPGTYTPAANDTRKIVMQFHDGSGWQTLPAMSINAVPYAMYANDSQSLGGVSATSYVRYSTIPTCTASEALHFNGASFNCVGLPTPGNFSASDVAAALSYTPANAASLTSISSNLNSVSSSVSAVSSSVYAVSSTVNGLASNFSSFQNSVAVSLAAMVSSQWVTSGSAVFYNTGNVGVGTANPVTKLEVSGGLRISMEAASCAANLAGTLRYNAGAVEYCNGVTWAAFGVSGAGLQSLNGSVSGTQTFAIGTAGSNPSFVSNNGVHTLNIPLASAASVTGGLLSNADYSTFIGYAGSIASVSSTKITSSAAAIAQVLGYAPVSATTLGNYVLRSNNLSDLTSATVARTNLGVGHIGTLSSVDLGSSDVSGTLAIARTPAYTGDVTKAAASNALILSNSGVTAGTYNKVTVDTKGRVTSSSALNVSDVTTALGYTPASASASTQWTTSGSTIYYNTGAVGIGTSIPASILTVAGAAPEATVVSPGNNSISLFGNGSAYFQGRDVTNDIEFVMGASIADEVFSGSMTGHDYSLRTGNATRLQIKNSTGYVGIGTTAPLAKLHVQGSSGTSETVAVALYSATVSSTGLPAYGIGMGPTSSEGYVAYHSGTGNSTAFGHKFFINGIERMRLNGLGNVGIGTSTPTAALQIKAGTSQTAAFKLTSGTLLATPASGAIEFDGFNYYITDGNNVRRTIATGSASGALDTASINNSSGNIVMTPNSSVVISSTTQSTSSSTGALVVNGGIGVAGNIYSSGTIVTSSNIQGASITATNGIITPYLAGGTASGGALLIDSTTNASKGKILLGGNVGIGITNPDEQLHLSKVLKFTNTIGVSQFRNPTADSFRIFAHDDAGTGNQYGTGDNNAKIFENVDGNNTTPDDGFFFVNHGTSGPVIAMSILGSGYTGINNNAPGALFEVGKNTVSSSSIRFSPSNSDQSSMRFTANSAANYIQSGVDYSSDSKKDLKFTSVGGISTWMTIQASTGNVGIGALTPTASLNVVGQPIGFPASTGTVTSGVIMRLENTGSQLAMDFGGNTGNGNWIQSTNKTNLANTYPLMLNPNGGNVGIGTTAPTAKLYIKGVGANSSGFAVYSPNANQGLDILPGYALDGTAVGIQEDLTATLRSSGSSAGNLAFATGNVEKMRLTSSGNFGIGTSAPTQKLDVNGTAKATAFIGDGSGITNISAANLTYYNYPSGYAGGAVSFSSLVQGVTGFHDYSGSANGEGSSYWAGITTKNSNTGAQFAVNWDTNAGTPSGFKVRAKDDNQGDWTGWRDVAFIDATVKKTGDTMTGPLNLPSNGLAVGTNQLVVSGTNVGIGTVLPDTALNIVGTGGADDDVHIDSYTNSQEGTVMLRRARGTPASASALLANDRIGFYTFRGYNGSAFIDLSRIQATTEADLSVSASANLQFITTENGVAGERIRITASGAVGVGTSTPTAGYRMDVFGDMQVGNGSASQTIRFRTANTDSGFIRFNSTSDTANNSWLEIGTTDNNDEPITFTQSGNERMRIHTNGGVGIGTNAPGAKLEVRSPTTGAITAFTQTVANAGILIDTDIVDASHGPGVFWRSTNSTPGKPKAGIWMYNENGPGSWLLFGTSNTYATGITNVGMAISPSGYVGIGTGTAPASRTLHVNGDAYINAIQGGQTNGSGNFHLDAWSSGADRSVYLNWAVGTGGAKVGNGSSNYGPIAASAFNVSSDRRLKENIKPIQNPLEKILKIDTVTFTWKDQTRNKMEGERIGLIAQNVKQFFPQAVKIDHGENTLPGGTHLVNYPDLVSPIIAAVKEFYALWFSDSKELHQTIDAQKRELASVKEQIEMLKTKSSGLEEQNKALKDYLCEKDPSAKICK